jgi:hypothetical protein
MLATRDARKRFALTLFLCLLNRPIRRLETYLRVGTVAEWLGLGTAAAAERDGFSVGSESVTLGVGDDDSTSNQVRTVV